MMRTIPFAVQRAAEASHPAVPDEPVRAIAHIQGNMLGGSMKDCQMLLLLLDSSTACYRQACGSVFQKIPPTF
jgi:hypothetical protein